MCDIATAKVVWLWNVQVAEHLINRCMNQKLTVNNFKNFSSQQVTYCHYYERGSFKEFNSFVQNFLDFPRL